MPEAIEVADKRFAVGVQWHPEMMYDSEEQLKLFRALTAARIRPYYVFTCDPIAGIDRFRVPLEKARRIERACAERIGGLALPRFVSDVPGAKRKVPL